MEVLIKLGLLALGLAFVVAIGAVFLLPLVALQAYVISDLWALFVVPWVGVELPTSLWTTAGVLLTLRVAAHGVGSSSSKDEKKSEDKSWSEIASPYVLLYFGTLMLWGMGHFYFWLST